MILWFRMILPLTYGLAVMVFGNAGKKMGRLIRQKPWFMGQSPRVNWFVRLKFVIPLNSAVQRSSPGRFKKRRLPVARLGVPFMIPIIRRRRRRVIVRLRRGVPLLTTSFVSHLTKPIVSVNGLASLFGSHRFPVASRRQRFRRRILIRRRLTLKKRRAARLEKMRPRRRILVLTQV